GLGAGAPGPPFHTRRRRFRVAVMGPHVLASSDSRCLELQGPSGRADGTGKVETAIRVDAQVSWQPPRQATERVPGAGVLMPKFCRLNLAGFERLSECTHLVTPCEYKPDHHKYAGRQPSQRYPRGIADRCRRTGN